MDIIDAAAAKQDEDYTLFHAKIGVCGVGGGGSNTVQRLTRMNIQGAALIAVNTEQRHLSGIDSSVRKILIGGPLTRGMGAGGFPEMGAKAAEYSKDELEDALKDFNLVFITAGMGGGTGTGAAPVIANICKKNGAIVIGIVTVPFSLERVRLNVAKRGIEELKKNVDTLVVIDNQKLVEVYKNLALDQAFRIADEITSRAVRGITETITTSSLINLDFADVRNLMHGGGLAMISVGEAHGANRVEEVVKNALDNRLLDVDYETATSVLMHITGGDNLTLGEANSIGNLLTERFPKNANVTWGARLDPTYGDKIELIAIFMGVTGSSVLGSASDNESKGDLLGIGEL